MGRRNFIFIICLLATTRFVAANPEEKTIYVDGLKRDYLVYTPSHPFSEKADGMMVCLHGFGRTMNDFFGQYNITAIADSLNLIIVVPQALEEQDQDVIRKANSINWVINEQISLKSVWGCGLRVRASLLMFDLLDETLNKEVDDVHFIDRMIDEILSDYSLPERNIFMLGTSMGGFMTYQYALRKGERLSGIISIAGSMGLAIEGMDHTIKIPVCDFHSTTDEVVFYNGFQDQILYRITLAMSKTDVINYWVATNSAGAPVSEQILNYPPTNDITVEKITYPDKDNEVIHYKINGAPHNYFFKRDAGDCMDHVEEIARFVKSHLSDPPVQIQDITTPKLMFYPNPVQDMIYLDTESGIVSIFDIAGRKIFTQSFMDGQANLSFLKSGIYLIEIQTGNTIQVNKLIKK